MGRGGCTLQHVASISKCWFVLPKVWKGKSKKGARVSYCHLWIHQTRTFIAHSQTTQHRIGIIDRAIRSPPFAVGSDKFQAKLKTNHKQESTAPKQAKSMCLLCLTLAASVVTCWTLLFILSFLFLSRENSAKVPSRIPTSTSITTTREPFAIHNCDLQSISSNFFSLCTMRNSGTHIAYWKVSF